MENTSIIEEEVLEESEETEKKPKKFGYDKREKKFFVGKLRIKKKWAVLSLIVLIIIALLVSCNISAKKKMQQAMMPQDSAVTRRDISKKVTGNSVIEPKDSYSIMTITTGEVASDYINEGDTVKKGDKLYQFDSETPRNSVQSAKNAVEKAQNSYNDALKSVSNLTVKSDVSGIVSEVFVTEGDNVQNGGKIASVYSDKVMKIKIPFNETDAQSVYVGSEAVLTVSGTGNEIIGTVTNVGSATVSTNGHNQVRYVTIEAENPGALGVNDTATAMIGDVACNDAGTFEYAVERTITAESSGEIISLNISENDTVYSGQSVAILESSSASTSLKNAKLSLDDAKLSLEKAQKGLDDYTITAPISGTVVTKNAKAGDKIEASNSSTPMCIIYDLSSVQFDIEIDETEVALVKVGQEVTVTADAIADRTFKGIVEKVSIDGVSTNGVTSYPVTISIAEYGNLLPGMNVDAEIIVEEVKNVLTIPVSSLNRGNVVYVKDDGTNTNTDGQQGGKPQMPGGQPNGSMPPMGDGQQGERQHMPQGEGKMPEGREIEAPEGYRAVAVTTGLSDDSYIEIKSGLNEGDLVRGQEIEADSMQDMMMQMHNNAMQGGMPPGGGMPAGGGMPGGGMQGGNRSGGGMPGGR